MDWGDGKAPLQNVQCVVRISYWFSSHRSTCRTLNLQHPTLNPKRGPHADDSNRSPARDPRPPSVPYFGRAPHRRDDAGALRDGRKHVRHVANRRPRPQAHARRAGGPGSGARSQHSGPASRRRIVPGRAGRQRSSGDRLLQPPQPHPRHRPRGPNGPGGARRHPVGAQSGRRRARTDGGPRPRQRQPGHPGRHVRQ